VPAGTSNNGLSAPPIEPSRPYSRAEDSVPTSISSMFAMLSVLTSVCYPIPPFSTLWEVVLLYSQDREPNEGRDPRMAGIPVMGYDACYR
jgi:hypothetical protein